jgi:hypothetical protein
MRITERIKQEIQTFKMAYTLPNGLEHDHYDVLKRIEYAREGEFYDCDDDEAVYWPLGKDRAPHYSKKLNVDVKHFRPVALGDKHFYQGWILNMRFQRWAKDTGFSIDLDDLTDACTDYGSAVMKLVPAAEQGEDAEKTKYDLKECNLNKLYFDTSRRPINSGAIIEEHELTEYLLKRKNAWVEYLKGNGKTVKDVLEKAEKVSVGNENNESNNQTQTIVDKFKIYERVGEFELEEYEEKEANQHCVKFNGEPKYLHGFYCGNGADEIVLWEEEIEPEDCLYYDFHTDKYKDRFLGVGVYERLFDLQRQVNELVNYNRDAAAVASLLLFYSNNSKIQGQNIIREAKSGNILGDKLEQMAIDNRFIDDFLNQLQAIEAKADKLCLIPEPGDDTVRGKVLTLNETASAFRSARNRILYRLFTLLEKKILPGLVEDWNEEDVMEIANDEVDIRVYDEVMLKFKMNQYIAREWARGVNPSMQDKQRFAQETIRTWDREGRRLEEMKGFFNFKYGFKIDPFNELENQEMKNQTMQWIITTIMANPAAANLPYMRQFAEENGIHPHKMSTEEMQAIMQASVKQPEPVGAKPDGILSQVKDNG